MRLALAKIRPDNKAPLGMNYVEKINGLLMPKTGDSPLVLDLFAGCGGLALGFEAQGFQTMGFELDADCCATYRRNLHGDCEQVKLAAATQFPRADVVIGGPPCQPFSVGGNQNGIRDSRDGFPAFISCIEQAQPKIWMFENVRGLMYKNRDYLTSIVAELEALGYVVEFRVLKAVEYGVPQNRERVIVVGHQGEFNYPLPLPYKVTAGEALEHLQVSGEEASKFLTPSMDAYVEKYEKASSCITPRDLHLDRPARTVTCRNLAGATGDMHRLVMPDGRRRRLTVREGARLQSFPDWFEFQGSETSQFNQVGNAVPPLLAYYLAGSFKEYLESNHRLDRNAVSKRRCPVQQSLLSM